MPRRPKSEAAAEAQQMVQSPLLPAKRPRYELKTVSVEKLVYDAVGPQPDSALVENIKNFGILQPIEVEPEREDGLYAIRDGRRRYLAARTAGLTRIPCIVLHDVDSQVVRLSTHALRRENQAVELGAIEALIERYYDRSELPVYSEIARVTGMTVQAIKARLRLAGLIPGLRAALIEDRISASVGEACCKLAVELQQRAYAILAERGKLTMADVRDLKKVQAEAELPNLDLDDDLASGAVGPDWTAIQTRVSRALAILDEAQASESADPALAIAQTANLIREVQRLLNGADVGALS